MKKFLQIIESYEKRLVTEMDTPPPNAAPPPDGPSSPPAPAPETPDGEPEAPVDDQPDVPAAIATMGSLLAKALTLPLSKEDRLRVARLPQVTEKNANEVIDQLVNIMKSYSADIDMPGI